MWLNSTVPQRDAVQLELQLLRDKFVYCNNHNIHVPCGVSPGTRRLPQDLSQAAEGRVRRVRLYTEQGNCELALGATAAHERRTS